MKPKEKIPCFHFSDPVLDTGLEMDGSREVGERAGGWGLTATVDMETDGRAWQAVHVVTAGAGLHIHAGIPLAAVVVEAGTGGQCDDATAGQWVAAVEPDGRVGAAVVLRDAEGGHGISRHAREAVPLPVHVVVAQGHAQGAVHVVVRVPPRLVQADVSGTRVHGCKEARVIHHSAQGASLEGCWIHLPV